MRRVLFAISAIGLFCTLGTAAASAGTLDQQQADASDPSGYVVYSSASLAQSFTAGISGGLDQVDLYLHKNGSPSDLSVQIRNQGADPGNTVLASASVPAFEVPTSIGEFVPVRFASPPAVVAGSKYAIVAYASGSGADEFDWQGSTATNPYPAGAGFFSSTSPPSGAWGPISDDLAFKTYVVPPTASTPVTPVTTVKKQKCKKHKKKHRSAESAKKKCKKKKRK